MLKKTFHIFLLAVFFWGVVDIVMTAFDLGRMEIFSLEWWLTCAIIGIGADEIVEYFNERKKKKVDGKG